MSAIDTTADRPGFAEFRAGGIFPTAVADAYTGSYGGAYNAVARKLGLLAPTAPTARMDRGNRWETRIADLVHLATGYYVFVEQAWCSHPADTRWRAIIDGLLHQDAEAAIADLDTLLEIKTIGVEVRVPWDRWKAQTQFGMHVTNTERALIAWAVIDDENDRLVSLRFEWLDRDDQEIARLVDVAEMLWEHIQAGTLPDPDCPSALDVVKEVTAVADPAALPVDVSDLTDDIARFVEIKAAVKAVEDERDRLEALIRSRLGRATKGTANGYSVSLSKPSAVRTDAGNTAFLAAHPELAKEPEIDSTRAKAEAKAEFAAIPREAKGSRRLTIKET